ncbi:hypothetical protein [Mediterranea massiliensis]|uniref:hypothetical protein n=1 Tax=Mediterranea massiliensis TaxID=1841865 RepID=UPI0025A460A9|nr:hypothetical protein [Mediterranea massiliensis]MDM8338552.1 hypothetical protein [Mediterranea massiliensis]
MKKALFCLGLFLLSTAALQAQSKWTDEGCYDISWYDKDAETYSISSASQLAGLAYLVNNATDLFEDKVVELTADIDLAGKEWVPIGDNDQTKLDDTGVLRPTAFHGTFDGKNHTVSNMQIDIDDNELASKDREWVVGLFGESKGLIQNLHMEGGSIKVQLTTNLPYEQWNHSISTGGVCGKGKTVSRCTSSANIDVATRYTEGYTGGVVGQGYVEYCENTGKVTGTNGSCIGGVLGSGQAYRCTNRGEVVSIGRDLYVGGIAGSVAYRLGSTSLETGNSYADGCINYGNVSNTADNGFVCYMGGIAGTGDLLVNCMNYGNLNADVSCPEFYSNEILMGGICVNSSLVVNSANLGKLTASGKNGRIVQAGVGGSADNCYNIGQLSATNIHSFDIQQDAVAFSATNCYYTQETESSSNSTLMSYADMCKDEFTQKLNNQAAEICLKPWKNFPDIQPAEWQSVASQTPQLTDKCLHTMTVKVDNSYDSPQFLNFSCEAGSISVDRKTATAGTEIEVKVTPGENCTFQSLRVYKVDYMQSNPYESDLLFEQNTLDPFPMPDEKHICIAAYFSTPEGIEEQQADAKLKITTDGRNLTISSAQAGVVEILSASGQLLLKESHDGSFQFAAPQPGLYIVKARLADGSTVVRKVMAN